MNTDTGHVIDTRGMSPEQLRMLAVGGYEEVPVQLAAAAAAVIADGGVADRRRHPQISRYAKHRRKARRKIERATRRANRNRK